MRSEITDALITKVAYEGGGRYGGCVGRYWARDNVVGTHTTPSYCAQLQTVWKTTFSVEGVVFSTEKKNFQPARIGFDWIYYRVWCLHPSQELYSGPHQQIEKNLLYKCWCRCFILWLMYLPIMFIFSIFELIEIWGVPAIMINLMNLGYLINEMLFGLVWDVTSSYSNSWVIPAQQVELKVQQAYKDCANWQQHGLTDWLTRQDSNDRTYV